MASAESGVHTYTVAELERLDRAVRIFDLVEHSNDVNEEHSLGMGLVLIPKDAYDQMYHFSELGHPVAQQYVGFEAVY